MGTYTEKHTITLSFTHKHKFNVTFVADVIIDVPSKKADRKNNEDNDIIILTIPLLNNMVIYVKKEDEDQINKIVISAFKDICKDIKSSPLSDILFKKIGL